MEASNALWIRNKYFNIFLLNVLNLILPLLRKEPSSCARRNKRDQLNNLIKERGLTVDELAPKEPKLSKRIVLYKFRRSSMWDLAKAIN